MDSLKHFLCQKLRKDYRDISKIPADRRTTETYKRKESTFVTSLNQLLDISIKSLYHSNVITPEDKDFLLNHWDKTISTVKDQSTSQMVQQRLDKQNKYQVYAEKQKISENATGTLDISTDISQTHPLSTPRLSERRRKQEHLFAWTWTFSAR